MLCQIWELEQNNANGIENEEFLELMMEYQFGGHGRGHGRGGDMDMPSPNEFVTLPTA